MCHNYAAPMPVESVTVGCVLPGDDYSDTARVVRVERTDKGQVRLIVEGLAVWGRWSVIPCGPTVLARTPMPLPFVCTWCGEARRYCDHG